MTSLETHLTLQAMNQQLQNRIDSNSKQSQSC